MYYININCHLPTSLIPEETAHIMERLDSTYVSEESALEHLEEIWDVMDEHHHSELFVVGREIRTAGGVMLFYVDSVKR